MNDENTFDYDVDFEAEDAMSSGLEKANKTQETFDLDVQSTSKDIMRKAQDMAVSISMAEMERQYKEHGVYDVKLFNFVKDLCKHNEVSLDDKEADTVLANIKKVQNASKLRVKEHKEEARKYKMN